MLPTLSISALSILDIGILNYDLIIPTSLLCLVLMCSLPRQFFFFPFDMLCNSSVIDRHDVLNKMNCEQAFCNVVVRCRKRGNIL